MPSKYQIITELAASTARDITSSAGKYMAFLTTAANNFKYRFLDQLLIYAQKPDATACAEIDFWNRHGRLCEQRHQRHRPFGGYHREIQAAPCI